MKKTVPFLVFCLIFLSIDAVAQVKKKTSVPKTPKPAASEKFSIPADYEYRFYLNLKGQLSCTILSVSDSNNLALTDSSSVMNAIFSSGTDRPLNELIRPRIILDAEPAVDLSKVLDTLNALRVSSDQQIELNIAEGLSLRLSKLRKKSPGMEFPNPLRLVVRLGEGKKVTLNNDVMGTYPDMVKLSDQLARIFTDREANGVFGIGTNDIETTISIVFPMTGYRFTDLIDVARALNKAGAKPLILDIDSYDEVEVTDLIRRPIIK